MKILLFILVNFFAAFGILDFSNSTYPSNKEKFKKNKYLKYITIFLFALGLIGNYFLCSYLLNS